MEKSSALNETEDHLKNLVCFHVTDGTLLIAYLLLLHIQTNPKQLTKFWMEQKAIPSEFKAVQSEFDSL